MTNRYNVSLEKVDLSIHHHEDFINLLMNDKKIQNELFISKEPFKNNDDSFIILLNGLMFGYKV